MNGHLVLDVHLVKLIDAADAVVSQHKCSSFDAELASLRVFTHTCCQACRIACFAAAVNRPSHELTDVLQELAFSGCWVSNDTNIDVTAELDLICGVFLDTTELLQ